MAAGRIRRQQAGALARSISQFALAMALAGCGAADPVPALIAQLRSTDNDARIAAAEALRELGPAAKPAVPALSECLQELHPGLRQSAARALGEIGEETESVRNGLTAALKDRELSVRMAAAWSLHKLDPDAEAHIPVLTQAMEAGEGGTIVAVGKLGAEAQWALPTLTRLLRDSRPGIRRLAAEAIGRIGPDPAARTALQRAVDDPDDRVRAAATTALESAGTSPGA